MKQGQPHGSAACGLAGLPVAPDEPPSRKRQNRRRASSGCIPGRFGYSRRTWHRLGRSCCAGRHLMLRPRPHTPVPVAEGRLARARELIRAEADALLLVADRLDGAFDRAVELLLPLTGNGSGRLAITGTGKSADV